MRNLACVLILFLACGVAVAAPEPVTSVEGMTEYRLDNGMQVLLFPDNSEPTVTVNVTYFVGSRHEGRGEKGMAHLLEHMVFKGTPNHPEIWTLLEDHGARFNGTTWTDRTNYYETLPTSEPGNLEWALQMEADRMINSHVRQEDLATEFSVVRNEFEMGENNPTSVLMDRLMSTAYLWHSYGDSTIGSKSDIERVPIDNLKKFYQRYYQPDNAMLVIAGDFDPEKALGMVVKHFGAIPRPERMLEETYTIEPVQDGARHVELKRVGDVAACGTVYHVPPASHEDYAAVDVIQEILTAEPGGRLYKEMVEPGIAASIFGIAFGWREPSAMLNMAQVRAGQAVEPAMEKMIEVIEGLSRTEITDAEVKRAKTALLTDFDQAMRDSGRIGVVISEWAAAGDWRLMFLHRDRIAALTTDDVRKAAARYFKETNRTSGVFHPIEQIDRADVPEMPDVQAMLQGYTGGEAVAEGEEFEATTQNIESRVTRTTLKNGMQLALLPKENRGDAVAATLTVRYGTEKDLKGRTTAVGMVPDMLMRGTAKYSYQQIRDRLDELKASVRFGGGAPGVTGVQISTERQYLPAVIELVEEILRNPTFPAAEFEIVRNEQLAALEEQLSEPQAQAFTFLMRALNPYPADDVRYVATIEETIERVKKVQLEDLKSFHKEFYSTGHSQMTIIGDFDAKEITGVLASSLGGWKSKKAFKRIDSPYKAVGGLEKKIHTPDKKMAMVLAGVNFELRDDDPDYPALHMANYVLGASAKSRLLDRLRQKEGLSYGAFSFLNAGSIDRETMFAGGAICAPENAAKAYDSLLDEFQRLVNDGIGAEELSEAKASFALQVKNSLANDREVAGRINNGLYLDRTMKYYEDLYAKIDALTTEQIQKALKRHVEMARMVKVQAGDLPKDTAAN